MLMNRYKFLSVVLTVVSLLSVSCGRADITEPDSGNGSDNGEGNGGSIEKPEVIVRSNGKTVEETVGVTHAGISYTQDETVSCMRDGADQIRALGSKVIKLWFTDDARGAYSLNCDWDKFHVENCIDLAETDYYKEVFGMDFKTYVLEIHTFDTNYPDSNVNWVDGMDASEYRRLVNEMYEFTKYLLQTYNGTGKEFILQNWEGDNMLAGRLWRLDSDTGYYYEVEKGIGSANAADDAMMRARIQGIMEWFNARQEGVDKAVAEFGGSSDVKVRNVMEINHIYLDARDEGWPYHDSPTLLKDVVPYTDCDLYSMSCWGSLSVAKAHELRERMAHFEDVVGDTYIDLKDGGKEKPRRPFTRPSQVSRLMVGEFGAIERSQGSEDGTVIADELTPLTDLRHRKVLQIQVESCLDLGLEFILYWELYCNSPVPPYIIDNHNQDRATSNDQLYGNWLIRYDGTVTEGYKYLNGIFRPDEALYFDEPFEYDKVYEIDGAYEGFEISGVVVSKNKLYNITQGKGFGREIKVFGSVDGKEFSDIKTDSFYTQCLKDEKQYVSKVKFVNYNPEDSGFRYFKVEKGSDGDRFFPDRIKFYKPKRNIVKKY